MALLGTANQIRLATGVIFGFLLTGIVAPSPAWASCGDYAQRGAKSAHDLKMSQTDHSRPMIPEERKIPCNGPNCSRGSEIPVVPDSPVPVNPTDWAMGLSAFTLMSQPPARISFVDGSARPVPFLFSVYHPPRNSY
jgi:hypothetical protein